MLKISFCALKKLRTLPDQNDTTTLTERKKALRLLNACVKGDENILGICAILKKLSKSEKKRSVGFRAFDAILTAFNDGEEITALFRNMAMEAIAEVIEGVENPLIEKVKIFRDEFTSMKEEIKRAVHETGAKFSQSLLQSDEKFGKILHNMDEKKEGIIRKQLDRAGKMAQDTQHSIEGAILKAEDKGRQTAEKNECKLNILQQEYIESKQKVLKYLISVVEYIERFDEWIRVFSKTLTKAAHHAKSLISSADTLLKYTSIFQTGCEAETITRIASCISDETKASGIATLLSESDGDDFQGVIDTLTSKLKESVSGSSVRTDVSIVILLVHQAQAMMTESVCSLENILKSTQEVSDYSTNARASIEQLQTLLKTQLSSKMILTISDLKCQNLADTVTLFKSMRSQKNRLVVAVQSDGATVSKSKTKKTSSGTEAVFDEQMEFEVTDGIISSTDSMIEVEVFSEAIGGSEPLGTGSFSLHDCLPHIKTAEINKIVELKVPESRFKKTKPDEPSTVKLSLKLVECSPSFSEEKTTASKLQLNPVDCCNQVQIYFDQLMRFIPDDVEKGITAAATTSTVAAAIPTTASAATTASSSFAAASDIVPVDFKTPIICLKFFVYVASLLENKLSEFASFDTTELEGAIVSFGKDELSHVETKYLGPIRESIESIAKSNPSVTGWYFFTLKLQRNTINIKFITNIYAGGPQYQIYGDLLRWIPLL